MPTYTPNYNFILPGVNDPADQDLWGGYLNENFESLDSLIAPAVVIPIGSGMDYWGTAAPSKWVFAFGQALSRTTYADLFAVIGTTYGVGDGATTFNLPDKRGRASFGKDDMGGTSANRITDQSGGWNGDTLGAAGGAETHTLVIAEMPAHTHNQKNLTSTSPGIDGVLREDGSGENTADLTTTSTGDGGAHNNLPPGIAGNYIIYTGVA